MTWPNQITPDESLILILSRLATGADIHAARCAIYSYRLACQVGNLEVAEAAEREIRQLIHNHVEVLWKTQKSPNQSVNS